MTNKLIGIGNFVEVTTPADVANATSISHDDAEKVMDVAATRAEHRDGEFDVILVLEDWATTYPNEESPISPSTVILAGEVEDYSAKAYYCVGAFSVNMDVLQENTRDELHDMFLTDLIQIIEEEEAEFDGQTYFPKSVVEAVLVVR